MRLVTRLLVAALVWHPVAALAALESTQWEPLPAGLGEAEFVAIGLNPAVPVQVWAATANTVYASPDGGQSWQARFRAPAGAQIRRVAIEPSDPPALLAATDRGLYGSFNGGARWSRVFRGSGEGEADCTHVAFHPARRGTALLGTRGGLFLSSDHGRHWNEVSVPQIARDVVDFALDAQDPDRLYLLAAKGMFAGTLTGEGWQQRLGVFSAEEAEVDESASLDTI